MTQTTQMTLIDALTLAMDEELARDPRVFITGEDVGSRRRVSRHAGLTREIRQHARGGFAAG